MKQSVTKQVFAALDANPYMKQAIKYGIANHSAIAKKLGVKAGEAAVKAAVRRYAEQLEYHDYSKGLKKLFSGTQLVLKSDVAVLILRPSLDSLLAAQKVSKILGTEFSMISSASAITLIINQKNLGEVKTAIGAKNVIESAKNQYILMLTSPEGIESTPGWVAFLTELLARDGINIREYYSCYTDTVFVLEKKDALKAYELLDTILG
ncbi:hypothetical protein ACFLQ2_00290 [archaeon]